MHCKPAIYLNLHYNEYIEYWLKLEVVTPHMTKQDRYSQHVNRAITHATILTQGFAHAYMDTGHLLIGVLLAKGSIGWQVMQELDLPSEVAGVYLKRIVPAVDRTPEPIPQSDDYIKTLEQAVFESDWLGNHYIGTEHLLLGMTRMNLGNAMDVLRLVDITPEQIRRRIRLAIDDGYSEFSMDMVYKNAKVSELSRRVLHGAQYYCDHYEHPAVGIGHLLLSMLRERRGVTSSILKQAGVDEQRLDEGLNLRDQETLISMEMVVMPAIEQSVKLGSHYVGADHLLLTLTLTPHGRRLLAKYGGDADRVNRLLMKHLKTD